MNVKTKQLLREKVWWPNIDKDVFDLIKTCHACQVTSIPPRKPPIVMTKLKMARTRDPSILSQALYHWATALPSVSDVLKKCVKTAVPENKNWHNQHQTFLLHYWATNHKSSQIIAKSTDKNKSSRFETLQSAH